MATIHHSHQRTPSSSHKFVLRPTTTRPSLTKNHSSNKLCHKSTTSKSRSSDPDAVPDDTDIGMSFLQFCTTCEKQIIVPSSSILYCSERFDGTDALASALGTPPSPPLLSEYEAFTKRPALSRRKLTHALTANAVPGVDHDGKADMDPTEWKPDGRHASAVGVGVSSSSTTPFPVAGDVAKTSRSHIPRTHSEAFLYLSQFHRSNDSLVTSASRRVRKDLEKSSSNRKSVAGTAPGIGAGAGMGKNFSLSSDGSNESSIAGSPRESEWAAASISGLTNGTAPSITFDLVPDGEEEDASVHSGGMGFAKQKVEAREDAAGSLSQALAASVI